MTRFRSLAGTGLLLGVLFAAMAFGGGTQTRPGDEVRETLYVLGTLVEIVIRGETTQDAKRAIASVAQRLNEVHRNWHAWRPGSLHALNTVIARGQTADVDPALARILAKGKRMACTSGGLFDPAVGSLIGLWGFHADSPPIGAPPSAAAVRTLISGAPRMTDLSISENRVSSSNPAVQLDLGGYAKGAALDMARAELRRLGIGNAILNAGGGVHVLGGSGDAAPPWRVAIRDPFQWGVVAGVSLKPGEALHTSGNYERYFDHGGTRFSHLLDPRTGYPVQGVVSVSVLDTDGALADGAATALAIAGTEDWPAVARAMGVTKVLVIDDDGTIFVTPEMRARLDTVDQAWSERMTTVQLPTAPPQEDCGNGGLSLG